MKGLLAALALLTAFIAAPAHAAPLKAVASFSVLGDMVARIGGERIGRNPKTGTAVALPGKHVPHFKPGKELRQRVNEGRDPSP